MNRLILFAFSLIFTYSAYADDIAESDTGLMVASLDCHIFEHEVIKVKFGTFFFDYLDATLLVHYKCVDANGNQWKREGQDSMIFPTLTFDWGKQAWVKEGEVYAYLRPGNIVELAENISTMVNVHAAEDHITGSVQLKLNKP